MPAVRNSNLYNRVLLEVPHKFTCTWRTLCAVRLRGGTGWRLLQGRRDYNFFLFCLPIA